MKIVLPLLKQEQDFTCVPACIRIVLKSFGIDLPESEIVQACQATPIGIDQYEAFEGISGLGFSATVFEHADFNELIKCIRRNQPVVVFLSVKYLPYAQGQRGTHAVVVNGFEENVVIFIDPARGEEIHLSLDTFQKAWQNRECIGIVIDLPSGKEL